MKAASWNHVGSFGDPWRLKLRLGLRLASFLGGRDRAYSTADAELIKQNEERHAPGLLAQRGVRDQVVVSPQVEAGFDIDVVGLGFGPAKTGSYVSDNPGFLGSQRSDVPSFDLLKGGNPDHGQLDSEFFLVCQWSDRWAIRAGFSQFRSDYSALR